MAETSTIDRADKTNSNLINMSRRRARKKAAKAANPSAPSAPTTSTNTTHTVNDDWSNISFTPEESKPTETVKSVVKPSIEPVVEPEPEPEPTKPTKPTEPEPIETPTKHTSSTKEHPAEEKKKLTKEEKTLIKLLQSGPFRLFDDEDMTEIVANSILEEIIEQRPFNFLTVIEDNKKTARAAIRALTSIIYNNIMGYIEDPNDELPNPHWKVDIVDMATDIVDEQRFLLFDTVKGNVPTISAGDVVAAFLDEDQTYHLALLVGEESESNWIVKFVDFTALTRSLDKDLVKFVEDLTPEARLDFGLTYSLSGEVTDTKTLKAMKTCENCSMCLRTIPITVHHLIPRSEHNRSNRPTSYLTGPENLLAVCRPCHSTIHRAENNSTLAKEYYTLELLMKHPKINSFVTWVSTQPITEWQKGAIKSKKR